jgi:ribosome-binding protein aMBF1 (putative translation factor)
MIKNERQYRITRAEAKRFEEALAEAERERRPRGTGLKLWAGQQEALRSQLVELREQLAEYERLEKESKGKVSFAAVEELPRALIRARIAQGLTQEGLARRMGLKPQQVQRYEATEYESASFRRIREVVQALGVRMERQSSLTLNERGTAEPAAVVRESRGRRS